MPARQRTFELVPTTLATPNGEKPPMTSKAAKKAYQKANRGPKVSRAEQRRLDAAELERQKKDFEREKAAKKAKAAREKKAEKEEEARRERKRLGLPEPNKFVRASQPSIARFVKGQSGKRKWEDIEEESEETAVGDDEVTQEQPAKQLTVIEEEDEGEDEEEETLRNEEPTTNLIDEERNPGKGGLNSGVASPVESDDEFGDFPSLTQVTVLEQIITSSVARSRNHIHSTAPNNSPGLAPEAKDNSGCLDLPVNKLGGDEDYLFDDPQILSDMANAQLLSEEAEAVARSDRVGPLPLPSHQQEQAPKNRAVNYPGERRPKAPQIESPAMKAPSFIQIPKKPPQKTDVSSNPRLQKSTPVTAPRMSRQISRSVQQQAPPSTQAFLDSLDDFLPSASQELQELLEENLNELPSPSNVMRDISPTKPLYSSPSKTDIDFIGPLSSQDFVLSSQDMREISPEKSKPVQELPAMTGISKAPRRSRELPAFHKGKSFAESIFDEFPSTQDMALTPEDLKDIETPSPAPPHTVNNLDSQMRCFLSGEPTLEPAAVRPLQQIQNLPQVKSKLPENQTNSSSVPAKPPTTKEGKAPRKPRAPPKPRERTRYFIEKEEDLFKAAVHESTLMAQQQNLAKQAAKRETVRKVPLKSPATATATATGKVNVGGKSDGENAQKGPGKRTLQRVQSILTDYGDDDFDGLSEADLAGLC